MAKSPTPADTLQTYETLLDGYLNGSPAPAGTRVQLSERQARYLRVKLVKPEQDTKSKKAAAKA